jgi:hypothetical protein
MLRPGVGWAVQVDSLRYIQLANGLRAGCGLAQYAGPIPASPALEGSITGRLNNQPVEYGFQAVWQGKGCGPAELLRTPGYPLFLAANPSLRSAVVMQGILGATAAFLVGLFVWHQWGLLAGLITETLVAFDVGSILFSNWLLTETLFTVCVTLGMLLQLVVLSRKTTDTKSIADLLAAALLLGVAAFVRPIGQVLLLVAPLPVLALDFNRAKKVMLFIVVPLVPLSMIQGWSYRNYEARGVWTFSSVGADNLYYHSAAAVLAHESAQPYAQVDTELLRSTKGGFDANPKEIEARAVGIVAAHPFVLAGVTLKGFLKDSLLPGRSSLGQFLGHDVTVHDAGLGLRQRMLSTLSSPLLAALYTQELLMTLFTWLGAALALRRVRGMTLQNSMVVLIPLFVSVLLLLAAAGPEASDRFRLPVVPMLAIVAGFGWAAPQLGQPTDEKMELV